ncbi:envelope stress response protein PspG [Yersinia sp. HM-2024]|uniref:envelope stress response protein PspG n=1 Tax=Yersinia sp. HM-2024 TaxID=3344550 RepID=UPI00370DC1DF
MFEIFFVIGFFIMLMVTGISLLGIFAALLVAAAFMMLGGLFIMMFKLLPWLILAVVVVWIWRSMQKPTVRHY